jgi:hypothetical protein
MYFNLINFGYPINRLLNKIMIQNEFFRRLTENHPFITVCSYANQDYVGIVQNRDDIVTTIYDYGAITDALIKEKFLELGEVWWWESNRLIPINLFLKEDWALFKPFLRTFNNKSLIVVHGPTCSMSDLGKRRSKRRSITLVKRMP